LSLGLTRDGRILFSTRILRLFAYGFLSVILALYLSQLGLSEVNIGLLLSLTLLGDTAISLWITTHADRVGRQRMLIAGAALMVLAAALFSATHNFYLLLLAATIGVISPSGNEVGPFLSIEQASLTQLVPDRRRTRIFAWYNLAGSFATALGALAGGGLSQLLQGQGYTPLFSYRVVVIGYASRSPTGFRSCLPAILSHPASWGCMARRKSSCAWQRSSAWTPLPEASSSKA